MALVFVGAIIVLALIPAFKQMSKSAPLTLPDACDVLAETGAALNQRFGARFESARRIDLPDPPTDTPSPCVIAEGATQLMVQTAAWPYGRLPGASAEDAAAALADLWSIGDGAAFQKEIKRLGERAGLFAVPARPGPPARPAGYALWVQTPRSVRLAQPAPDGSGSGPADPGLLSLHVALHISGVPPEQAPADLEAAAHIVVWMLSR